MKVRGRKKKHLYKNKEFFFKNRTHLEISRQVDFIYPIKLLHNEKLINNIHNKYPSVDKTIIVILLKVFFESMRMLLILGAVFNLQRLLFNFKLNFIMKKNYKEISPRVTMTTPLSARKSESDFD